MAALWAGDQIRRIDLHRLSRAESDQLLVDALGGPVDGVASAELWDAGHGNPLLLHEIVVAAISGGALAPFDGVWRVDDGLPMAGNVPELVRRRLSALSGEGRALLEDVAVGQPVDLADLERTYPLEVIEAAERGGYITVREDGQRVDVRIAYRAHLDVLRLDLAPGRLSELSMAHIERVEGHGGRRRDDPLRLARWYLDGTGEADPDVLLRAANLARGAHDFVTVERLVTAALLAATRTVNASRLRGEACTSWARSRRPRSSFNGPSPGRRPSSTATSVAATRSTNLFWGLIQPTEALAVLAAAEAEATSPAVLHELEARRASISLHSGWPVRALEEVPPLVDGEVRARLEASMVRSLALALGGSGEEAGGGQTDAGFAEHVALGDFSGIAHPGTHMVNKCVALTEIGRLTEAWDLASAGYEVAVSERVPIAKMWFALQLGRIELVQGRVSTARQWFREVVAHAGILGHQHPLRLGLAGIGRQPAATCSTRRRRGPGRRGARRIRRPRVRLLRVRDGAGRAPGAASLGAPEEGQARLGRPPTSPAGAARSRRRRPCCTTSCGWVATRPRPTGSTSWPAAATVGSCRRGRRWCGPCAADDAGGLDRGQRRVRGPRRAAVRGGGGQLAAADRAAAPRRPAGGHRAGQPRVPPWPDRVRGGPFTPLPPGRAAGDRALTAREREIAQLVAQGLPSRDVADQLFLSVRTVQSHLQRIFTKLGVTSRAEVAAALGR